MGCGSSSNNSGNAGDSTTADKNEQREANQGTIASPTSQKSMEGEGEGRSPKNSVGALSPMERNDTLIPGSSPLEGSPRDLTTTAAGKDDGSPQNGASDVDLGDDALRLRSPPGSMDPEEGEGKAKHNLLPPPLLPPPVTSGESTSSESGGIVLTTIGGTTQRSGGSVGKRGAKKAEIVLGNLPDETLSGSTRSRRSSGGDSAVEPNIAKDQHLSAHVPKVRRRSGSEHGHACVVNDVRRVSGITVISQHASESDSPAEVDDALSRHSVHSEFSMRSAGGEGNGTGTTPSRADTWHITRRQSMIGNSASARVRKSITFDVHNNSTSSCSSSTKGIHRLSQSAQEDLAIAREDPLGGVLTHTFLASQSSSVGKDYFVIKDIHFVRPDGAPDDFTPPWAEDLNRLRVLGHKNVQTVHAVTAVGGTISVIADFYVKSSISEQVFDSMAEPQLVRDLLRALRYVHDHNHLHGHLTLENVFQADIGSSFVIADFGLSNYFAEFSAEELYELGYHDASMFPPETINEPAPRKISVASDIWALGIILLKKIARLILFDESDYEVMFKQISEFTTSKLRNLDIGEDLAGLLLHMLIPDPKQRMTAAELLNSPVMKRFQQAEKQTRQQSMVTMRTLSNVIPGGSQLNSQGQNVFMRVPSGFGCDMLGQSEVMQSTIFSPVTQGGDDGTQENSTMAALEMCSHCEQGLAGLMFSCNECPEYRLCRRCYYQNDFTHDPLHTFMTNVVDTVADAFDTSARRMTVVIPSSHLNDHEMTVLATSGVLPDTLDINRRRHSRRHSSVAPAPLPEFGDPKPKVQLMSEAAAASDDSPDLVIDDFIDGRMNDMMLANFDMVEFPPRMFDPPLLNVVFLDVANNNLTSVPDQIELLVNLRRFVIANNQISELPDALGNLSDLEFLDANRNQLTSLPQTLMFCDNLTELVLDYNAFTEIPTVIFDLPLVSTILLAANPHITAWPEDRQLFQQLGCCSLGLDNYPSLFKTASSISQINPSIMFTWNKIYPDEIIENLYCGSLRSAQSLMVYERLSIGHLLTVGRGLEPTVPTGMEHKVVIVDDIEGATIDNSFEGAVEFVENAQEAKSGCLVHCFAGMSRSATTVIAYLMMKKGMRLDEAYCATRKGRPAIYPNAGFFNQLLALDEKLYPGQRPLDVESMERQNVPL